MEKIIDNYEIVYKTRLHKFYYEFNLKKKIIIIIQPNNKWTLMI